MDDTSQTDQISALALQISDSAKELKERDATKSGEARVKLQEAARKLTAALESPPEAIFRHAFEVPTPPTAEV